MEITFEKWEDGRWFVVLPDYDGPFVRRDRSCESYNALKPCKSLRGLSVSTIINQLILKAL